LAGTHLMRFASYCYFIVGSRFSPISFGHFKAAAEQVGTMRLSPLWAAKNQHRIMATTKSQLACTGWQVVQVQRTIHRTCPLTSTYISTSPMENSGLSNILSARGESLETLETPGLNDKKFWSS